MRSTPNFKQEHEAAPEGPESILRQPNAELLEALRDAHKHIMEKIEERKEINEDINLIFERLEQLGISKKAAKVNFALFELEVSERRIYDLSSTVVRRALGMPQQGDLFLVEQVKATVGDAGEISGPV